MWVSDRGRRRAAACVDRRRSRPEGGGGAGLGGHGLAGDPDVVEPRHCSDGGHRRRAPDGPLSLSGVGERGVVLPGGRGGCPSHGPGRTRVRVLRASRVCMPFSSERLRREPCADVSDSGGLAGRTASLAIGRTIMPRVDPNRQGPSDASDSGADPGLRGTRSCCERSMSSRCSRDLASNGRSGAVSPSACGHVRDLIRSLGGDSRAATQGSR